MKRTMISLIAAVGLCGAAVPALAHGESNGGEHVSMSDLPTPVQDTIKREAKSNRVEEIRKSTDKSGSEVYKAEVVEGKRGTDLTIASDGKLLHRSSHDEAAERSRGEQ